MTTAGSAPVIAVDLGGTKSIVAVCSPDGTELGRERFATDPGAGGDAYADRVAEAIMRMPGGAEAAAVGIGSPGPLDRGTGTIQNTPNLPWGEYPLRDRLAERTGIQSIAVENDCTSGGLGEFHFGAARGASSMVYYGVGTGVGGCVIVEGKVLYGASGDAGELGHTIVWLDGPVCGCGRCGWLCTGGRQRRPGMVLRIQPVE